uniref:Alpha/beta hydrolase fold-3 domain-containing protein n=1 Tax=Glossina morsitans morsitans TaxID=37546 RepID=A0A1B0G9V8_GLOMM
MNSNTAAVDFEKEYSPSLNIKRFRNYEKPYEKVVQHFISHGKAATTLAFRSHKVRENVRYGGLTDNQLVDIIYNDSEFGSPIFAYIHGGYWTSLDKSSSGTFVGPLLEQGYRVLLVDYNLCPTVTLEQLCEQIRNFFKWLQHYAKETQPSSISICGHSAGAHLLCQIFNEDFLRQQQPELYAINHLFLISGVYDLRELWKLTCCNENNKLGLDAVRAEQLSPLCWPYNKKLLLLHNKQDLQVHVMVAENDSATFIKQSQSYADKLKLMELKVDYKIFNDYDHFNIIEDTAIANSIVSLYIKEKLNLK